MEWIRRILRRRQGEEFAEAALVLPILILTILSMILLILYFYSCLNTQTALHNNLMRETAESSAIFHICTESDSVSSQMEGITDILMEKRITGRMYALNFAEIVRAGELIEVDW